MTKQKFTAFVLLAIGVAGTIAGVLAGARPEEKAKSDKDDIQGTWVFVSAEEGGKAVPEDELKKFEMVFASDKVKFPIKQEVKELGYKLDPARKPKQIDIAFGETETAEGIYELDGDKLKVCLTKPGHGDRPTKFDSTEGRESVLLVLKRKK
jgi:uncharacterized protein (TIGR03067 family)